MEIILLDSVHCNLCRVNFVLIVLGGFEVLIILVCSVIFQVFIGHLFYELVLDLGTCESLRELVKKIH